MDGSSYTDAQINRPGVVSAFFVYKAGLFALAFWAWLAVLAIQGGAVSGWHIVAATGAATTTLVAVVLGVRYAIESAAATRQQAVMRAIVELSWYTFSPPVGSSTPTPTPAGTGPDHAASVGTEPVEEGGTATGADADIIMLAPDSRPRQRR